MGVRSNSLPGGGRTNSRAEQARILRVQRGLNAPLMGNRGNARREAFALRNMEPLRGRNRSR